jgi:hypothetical protein
MAASQAGRYGCVHLLLEAGANPNLYKNNDPGMGWDSMTQARDHLDVLQLLCAYAPTRENADFGGVGHWALQGTVSAPPECVAWITATLSWVTPLHHFEFMPFERVQWLLDQGADVHARDEPTVASSTPPTPLSLALAVLEHDPEHERAALIVEWAEAE